MSNLNLNENFNETLTFQDVADGTENFVNTLFAHNNMEMILRCMINQSKKGKNVGWLPSNRLTENEITDTDDKIMNKNKMMAVSRIVSEYKLQDKEQQKNIYDRQSSGF